MARLEKFVALVRPDDDEYRAYCGAQAQSNLKLRDRLEPSAMMRISGVLENVTREWLASVVTLQEERIIRSARISSGGQKIDRYRELDAVETDGKKPTRVIEIKVTSNPAALKQARKQLDKSKALLRQKWLRIAALAVIVDMLPEGIEEMASAPARLDAAAHELIDCGGIRAHDDYLHVSARELWTWGVSTGRSETSSMWHEALEESVAGAQRRLKRRMLIEEGVPQAEWPEELREIAPDLPDARMLTFGDQDEEESPFARALRKAGKL
jgi:hypothetical protein